MADLELFTYVSTKAGVDPVKTIILFPPANRATDCVAAEVFARDSGWVDAIEEDAAVLVIPTAPTGWSACERDLPMRIYQERRRTFRVPDEGGIPGRGGALWAWETLIYLVGYGDGATFAGDFVLSCPGFAAAVALVDGSPAALGALDEPSCHWLVPNPSDYRAFNRDIPFSVWFMGAGTVQEMLVHAISVGGLQPTDGAETCGMHTDIWKNPDNEGVQARVTLGLTGADPRIAPAVMHEFFNRIIRWKNAPDGTLASRRPKDEFYTDGTYRHHEVLCNGGRYHYAVYLPEGMEKEDARELPLVISLHGRGEPTWIFAAKNGWEDLADETRAFAVLLPDSPQNVWSIDRDGEALCEIVSEACTTYGFDAERVYITGFSNGACFTCQMASTYPELFAAASPWNGPLADAIISSDLGSYVWREGFEKAGWDMPLWMCFGDSDDKAPCERDDDLAVALAANRCSDEPIAVRAGARYYTADDGYASGERLQTRVFADGKGVEKVCFTVMKNMPHGAIADEARAAWAFMSQFKRVDGARKVEVI